ncbi:hypothetical protein ACKI1I_21350 [Streptomyces turgidiscabies]|uniref:Uncharacterized protein n=1 Tax=Streptomyces turgidiscabies (strain Car8) TaxID=698760 RepID=L7ES64_STRT8|nr:MULTISPECIES: hypothetical protein [Streptomyces]ELP61862.1 hypothetical protein STRTUCAR8_09958 [Streptomyces turgidiscabies Car8]MDX3496539.1 hypothetical protein [Streptomyces turgidiscabies]GAQ72729.1 hypothetical protein T45_04484 [Streptomyces turgidiscabies]
MLDEIDAVDWGSIPGRPDWYEPDRAAHGLRALSEAANLVQAAKAGSQLGGGGIVHGHSGAVFPSAVVATPLLLDIVERGHPAAGAVALGLLDEALSCCPHAGYTRVVAPDGLALPLCCAIADRVRARTDLLVGLGKRGKSLLAEAAAHWRFEIRECVADGSDTAAFGNLAGCLSDGVHAAEMHLGGVVTVLNELTLEYPPAEGALAACVRVIARHPGELLLGATLIPAECGDRVH